MRTFSILLVAAALLTASPTWAAVTTDGTFGPATSIAGPNYMLTPSIGRVVGGNLFQSFREFNIGPGESATFTAPSTVSRILARVTGGSPTSVDGMLRTSGTTADLYLINPAGILFGVNAQINISHAFFASTADTMKLGSNGSFNATSPSNSVLTVDPPSAFGFVSNRGEVVAQGVKQVLSAPSVSLVAGKISLADTSVNASGHANLLAVTTGRWRFSLNPRVPFSLPPPMQ